MRVVAAFGHGDAVVQVHVVVLKPRCPVSSDKDKIQTTGQPYRSSGIKVSSTTHALYTSDTNGVMRNTKRRSSEAAELVGPRLEANSRAAVADEDLQQRQNSIWMNQQEGTHQTAHVTQLTSRVKAPWP